MLYLEAIEPRALDLLKELLKIPALKELRLAGGTSLALQYGHRKSVDIDLFGRIELDSYSIEKEIDNLGTFTILQNLPNLHTFIVNEIKVDIVNYPYPWISEMVVFENLRLASPMDIGAMKLAAITGRGAKKDYADLYFLLQQFSLKELLSFYERKYKDGSIFMVLKSLPYFADADEEVDPVYLTPVNWSEIKEKILAVHSDYLRSLD